MEPEFTQLTYADAGVYRCEVSMTGLVRHESFELVVEGESSLFTVVFRNIVFYR